MVPVPACKARADSCPLRNALQETTKDCQLTMACLHPHCVAASTYHGLLDPSEYPQRACNLVIIIRQSGNITSCQSFPCCCCCCCNLSDAHAALSHTKASSRHGHPSSPQELRAHQVCLPCLCMKGACAFSRESIRGCRQHSMQQESTCSCTVALQSPPWQTCHLQALCRAAKLCNSAMSCHCHVDPECQSEWGFWLCRLQ